MVISNALVTSRLNLRVRCSNFIWYTRCFFICIIIIILGLFRGRGDHPKMGAVKRRVVPGDVIINCSKGTAPKPPHGQKWKEVRHDNTVTWLASWTENVQSQVKYIMLNSASRLKGEKDWQKYEIARKLKGNCISMYVKLL